MFCSFTNNMQVTDTAWKTHSPGSGEASLNFTIGYLWESVSSSLSYEELTRCMIIVSHHTLIKQCGMTFVSKVITTTFWQGGEPDMSPCELCGSHLNSITGWWAWYVTVCEHWCSYILIVKQVGEPRMSSMFILQSWRLLFGYSIQNFYQFILIKHDITSQNSLLLWLVLIKHVLRIYIIIFCRDQYLIQHWALFMLPKNK